MSEVHCTMLWLCWFCTGVPIPIVAINAGILHDHCGIYEV